MEHVEAAYREGMAAAERDIASGQPKLRYRARGAWGDDLARTLQARFGVELVVLSCFTDGESSSFDAGYNVTIEAEIDRNHGAGSVAAVRAEVQLRRGERYKVWTVEQRRADPSAGPARDNE